MAAGSALVALILAAALLPRHLAPLLERARLARYEPRELVPGDNFPPAPRVGPEGAGANRLWLVPLLQIAILCTGAPGGRDAAWSDTRIPNLILRAARDFRPSSARPGAEVSALVPGH